MWEHWREQPFSEFIGAANPVFCLTIHLMQGASATDNPLVFIETGDVVSGGNFHGAPLAFGFDYAAIALTDLINIAERRIDRLVNPDKSD